MAKYDPLFAFLCKAADGPVSMTFAEIEELVGPLPVAATGQRRWWGNDVGGGVQASAWLNAGRDVDHVDLAQRIARFSAARWRRGS